MRWKWIWPNTKFNVIIFTNADTVTCYNWILILTRERERGLENLSETSSYESSIITHKAKTKCFIFLKNFLALDIQNLYMWTILLLDEHERYDYEFFSIYIYMIVEFVGGEKKTIQVLICKQLWLCLVVESIKERKKY